MATFGKRTVPSGKITQWFVVSCRQRPHGYTLMPPTSAVSSVAQKYPTFDVASTRIESYYYCNYIIHAFSPPNASQGSSRVTCVQSPSRTFVESLIAGAWIGHREVIEWRTSAATSVHPFYLSLLFHATGPNNGDAIWKSSKEKTPSNGP